jgi:hypothetical protein
LENKKTFSLSRLGVNFHYIWRGFFEARRWLAEATIPSEPVAGHKRQHLGFTFR